MVSGRVERGNTRRVGNCGISRPTRICLCGVGVVNVPVKVTSSDLNRVSKKRGKRDIIKRRVSSRCKGPGSGVEGGGSGGHGGKGGKDEMDVEGEGDREGSDVSHPRGSRFAREERERIGGEDERKSLTGCEGTEVSMKTVGAQESIEGDEMREKMGLQDGTRQKSVSHLLGKVDNGDNGGPRMQGRDGRGSRGGGWSGGSLDNGDEEGT